MKKNHSMLRRLKNLPWLALSAVLLLRIGVVDAHYIPSGSMEPTLAVGDMVFADKTAYGFTLPFTDHLLVQWSTPKRGDIVTFVPEHKDDLLIKRVIGVAGDTVATRDGWLLLNGERVGRLEGNGLIHEQVNGVDYLTTRASPRNFGPVRVPDGHLLVLGDNRANSADSRVWGFLPVERVRAKAVFRHLSAAWLRHPGDIPERFGDLYHHAAP
jgi:signal peptidase I